MYRTVTQVTHDKVGEGLHSLLAGKFGVMTDDVRAIKDATTGRYSLQLLPGMTSGQPDFTGMWLDRTGVLAGDQALVDRINVLCATGPSYDELRVVRRSVNLALGKRRNLEGEVYVLFTRSDMNNY
jgi:hypothetical protein